MKSLEHMSNEYGKKLAENLEDEIIGPSGLTGNVGPIGHDGIAAQTYPSCHDCQFCIKTVNFTFDCHNWSEAKECHLRRVPGERCGPTGTWFKPKMAEKKELGKTVECPPPECHWCSHRSDIFCTAIDDTVIKCDTAISTICGPDKKLFKPNKTVEKTPVNNKPKFIPNPSCKECFYFDITTTSCAHDWTHCGKEGKMFMPLAKGPDINKCNTCKYRVGTECRWPVGGYEQFTSSRSDNGHCGSNAKHYTKRTEEQVAADYILKNKTYNTEYVTIKPKKHGVKFTIDEKFFETQYTPPPKKVTITQKEYELLIHYAEQGRQLMMQKAQVKKEDAAPLEQKFLDI